MNRTWEKIANAFGSVGIAALAVAILLVPYSDLNAATSSAPANCAGGHNCATGCTVTSQMICSFGGCDTSPPNCTNCGCSPAKRDSGGNIVSCDCM